MKHLFKEGKFYDVDGNKVLKYESYDVSADLLFKDAIYRISTLLEMFELGKVSNTEYYYIFKKYGRDNKKTSEEIDESINKILSGNLNDVLNDTTLGIPDETVENDVFFDVNNDVVIIKGKDNIKPFVVSLAWLPYERLGVKDKTPELEEELILSQDIPLIRKIKAD